jgi:hypothetical protein
VKRLFVAAFLAAGPILTGCSSQSDAPTAEDVREHLQRGAAGQGTLGPIDRQDDPFVNPREGNPDSGNPDSGHP